MCSSDLDNPPTITATDLNATVTATIGDPPTTCPEYSLDLAGQVSVTGGTLVGFTQLDEPGGASQSSAYGPSDSVSLNNPGTYYFRAYAVENGCMSSADFSVSLSCVQPVDCLCESGNCPDSLVFNSFDNAGAPTGEKLTLFKVPSVCPIITCQYTGYFQFGVDGPNMYILLAYCSGFDPNKCEQCAGNVWVLSIVSGGPGGPVRNTIGNGGSSATSDIFSNYTIWTGASVPMVTPS